VKTRHSQNQHPTVGKGITPNSNNIAHHSKAPINMHGVTACAAPTLTFVFPGDYKKK